MKELIRNVVRVFYNIFSGSDSISRSKFLATIPSGRKTLEIGPFTNPHLRGENVYYFDVQEKEELIKRAIEVNYFVADQGTLPDINYVSPTGDLSIIQDKFDQAYSAHCIEHQPDLIQHLVNVSELLYSDGKYYLTIPDKRYCFDALLPTTDLGSVIEASVEKRKIHVIANLIRHQALTVHNNALLHWFHIHGKQGGRDGTIKRTRLALKQFEESQGGYIDMHAWRITPQTFRQIINQLNELNYINLTIERMYPTTFGSNEFYVVLKKT